MLSKKNSVLGTFLSAPVLIIGSALALWQNEDRFDYYKAARDTVPIVSLDEASKDSTVSYTGDSNTSIPISGLFVSSFNSYYVVRRSAEIYSYRESRRDNRTVWDLDWYSSLENNSRNRGLRQYLFSGLLYPSKYEIDRLTILPGNIHFVDEYVPIPINDLELTREAKVLRLSKSGDYLYLRRSADKTTLGDQRVRYSGIPTSAMATYFGIVADGMGVGRVFEQNDGLISKIIDNDGTLHHLVKGGREVSLTKIKKDLEYKLWMTRIIGTAVLVAGFYIFFSTYTGILYGIPYVGDMVSRGVLLVSISLGVPISMFVIFTSLLFHHPLTILPPLILFAGVVYWFMRRSWEARSSARKVMAARLAVKRKAEAAAAMRSAAQTQAALTTGSEATPRATVSITATSGAGIQAASDTEAVVQANLTELIDDTGIIEDTFINLAVMAMAEGGFDKKENRFLVEWGRQNGVSAERMKALFAEARNHRGTPYASSRDELELLVCMAMTDGVVSRKEWAMLMRIAQKLGVPAMELRDMIIRIETPAPAAA